MRVTLWNEGRLDRIDTRVAALYPDGLLAPLARAARAAGMAARVVTLDDAEQGVSESLLDETDVLVWWGHAAHDEVSNAAVARVAARVLDGGMGFVALHSAHCSRPFRRLLDASGDLGGFREADDRERLWVVAPEHPLADGIDRCVELDREEVYVEPFAVPPPDELVLVSWFSGGEVFRSGCCWRRGRGRIVYLRPGHETCPSYHHPSLQRLVVNAVRWAAAST